MRFRLLMLAALLLAVFALSFTASTAQELEPIWTGQYYDNAVLAAPAAFTTQDSDIAFDWGFGSPGGSIAENSFSVRWTTDIDLNGGTYRFWTLADDNIRVTVDDITVLDTFGTGQVGEVVSGDIVLSEGTHNIRVDYREITQEAFAYLDFANLATNPTGPNFAPSLNPPANNTWTAQYYTNRSLAGTPAAIRGEPQAGGYWGTGAPLPSIPADDWSARWTTTMNLTGGDYVIRTTADDGVRVYVDGVLVIDEWHIASGDEYTATRTLTEGDHTITIDFYEQNGIAFLEFEMEALENPVGTLLATVTAGRLNVRDAPDPINGNVLTRIDFGEVYPAVARNADGSWVRLNVNGTTGWVNTDYISVPDLLTLPVEGEQPQATGYTVTATPYAVNIRTGPDTSFRDIGNLPEGDTAQVIGRNASSTWWQIDYNGIVGWVSAQYAILEAGTDVNQIPVTE
ncbi:MAG: hypothetical protein OHK0046_08550 [Anaerolineae bacterium]